MDRTIYVDGSFRSGADAAISAFDHGVLYGDGVFEGIRAYNGRVFKLERHVDRLFDSAKAIRLDIGVDRRGVAEAILETCRRNEIVDGYIRVVVTRGPGNLSIDPRSCTRPQLIVLAIPSLVVYRPAGNGLRVITSSLRRNAPDASNPSIKSLNYLNNVLARIEANDHGADEALLLDSAGYVAEATTDNVFIVTDRALRTPPTSTNLKGITRETILGLAAALGIACEERPMTTFDVWTAREVFVCGTAAEVAPVVTVDGRTIGDGEIGPVTAKLIAAYAELVRTTGTPIRSASAPSKTVAAVASSYRV